MLIETVLFDMGGTIEDVTFDRGMRRVALPRILDILAENGVHLPGDPETILDTILARNAEYKAWSERERIESSPGTIWCEWNLRDYGLPADRILPIAERLACAWELYFFHRTIRPDARRTLESLEARGYRLGVISNTSSRTQVHGTLSEYGIAGFFESVVLSSVAGVRKPHPGIFASALAAMGSRADRAAYVGDTLSRDVLGSKLAGFALAFQIRSFLTAGSDASLPSGRISPDYLVSNLYDIVSILDSIAESTGGRGRVQLRSGHHDAFAGG